MFAKPSALLLAALCCAAAHAAPKNGYSALWLLGYDIPAAEQPAWAVRYRTAITRTDAEMPPELAARRLPDLNNALPPCNANSDADDNCLNVWRKQYRAVRAALSKHQKLFRNADALADYDTLHTPQQFVDGADILTIRLPEYAPLLKLTHAAAAAELGAGRPQQALHQSCRNLKTARMLAVSPHGLVEAMVGNAMLHRNIHTAAAILAEQPQLAHKLPENCAGAFAPLPVQAVSLCNAMQTEQRYQELAVQRLNAGMSDIWRRLTGRNTARQAQAKMKRLFDYTCTDAAAAQVREDVPFALPELSAQDLARCGIGEGGWCESVPSYEQYVRRMQDTQLRLRAFQAALAVYRLPAPRSERTVADTVAKYRTSRRLMLDNSRRPAVIRLPLYEHKHGSSTLPLNWR